MDATKIGAAVLVAAGGVAAGYKWITERKAAPPQKVETIDPKPDLLALWPSLVESFLSTIEREYKFAPKHIERLRTMINYTCIGGKLYRAGLVVTTVQQLCAKNRTNFANYKERACVLGWCIELLQAHFLVLDDIMDKSETRRGQPCWYKNPEIQLDAVNDGIILESFIYHLLKVYFRGNTEMYINLVDLFHQVTLDTQMGQMLDLTSNPQGRKDPTQDLLAGFTQETYDQIVCYKTALYTFYLSMASGLILCGFGTPKHLATAKAISIELGNKFQIQDDYLDCFGDPEVIGKIGTDIKDHKCSWLIVQALQLVTDEQMEIIRQHYGQEDEKSEQVIKDLFTTLDLPAIYAKQEEESYKKIMALIESATDLPSEMFLAPLRKVHGRQK